MNKYQVILYYLIICCLFKSNAYCSELNMCNKINDIKLNNTELMEVVNACTTNISSEINLKESYLNRGLAYSYLKYINLAISDYSKVLQIDKTNKYAYQNRGNEFKKIKQYNKALDDYLASINNGNNNSYLFFSVAFVYSEIGEIDKAIDYYDKSIASDPFCGECYNDRAIAYFQKYHGFNNSVCNELYKACYFNYCEGYKTSQKTGGCRSMPVNFIPEGFVVK